MRKSIRALVAICPKIARAHKLIGSPPARNHYGGFVSLIRIIIDQQISVQAGAAIWKRVEVGLIQCNPGQIVKVGEEALRSYGLSRPKAKCIHLLAVSVLNGALNLKALETCDNDAVLGQLMAIKGVGRWTAEIYLMFALNRPDVWPSGDLALAESVRRLLKLERRPIPNELEVIAERWRPERTAAAVFLWHYYKKLPIE